MLAHDDLADAARGSTFASWPSKGRWMKPMVSSSAVS